MKLNLLWFVGERVYNDDKDQGSHVSVANHRCSHDHKKTRHLSFFHKEKKSKTN